MNQIKKVLQKVFDVKLNQEGYLIISKRFNFLDRVFLLNGSKKVYLIKTNNYHVIDISTVKDLFDYKICGEMKLFLLKFKIKFPKNFNKLLSLNGKYVYLSKEPVEKGIILFESFLGKNYSGHPKYIYEYLLSCKSPYRFVWTYDGNNANNIIPGNPIIVKRGSIKYLQYAAKAEYLVNNIVFPFKVKRKETIYLQTWHGTPLKRLGYDIEVDGPEAKARESFYKESRNWNYLITQNAFTSETLTRAFKYDEEILELGYPHNDILIENSTNRIKDIKEKLHIPKDKKVILYAPTWRDNDANGNWSFNFTLKMDLLEWQKRLGDKYIVLIRMHHLITKIKGLNAVDGFAFNVSSHDDAQELNLISDILITDYSSIFFDYAVSNKPILFFAYDYVKYAKYMRGFYLDMHKELPGPIIEKDKDLLDSIINIDKVHSKYQEAYENFVTRFCYLDDGKATERIVRKVFKEVNE